MSAPYLFPEELRFTCQRCGDCCRSWNVMLAPGERARLEALDWSGREQRLVEQPTVVKTSLPGRSRKVERLAREPDGACVYLGPDELCQIHRHFGAEAKPLMCRLYPFAFSRTAERWSVDCSFSCRAISQGSGARLEESSGDWDVLLADAQTRERVHQLDRRHRLEGRLLLEFQQHLLGFLAEENLPFFDRIRCCLQYVRLATTGDPTTPAAAALRAAIVTGLPRQIGAIPAEGGMDKSQRALFYQWLFLTLNPVPANFDTLPGRERSRIESERIRAGNRFRDRQGLPHLDNRELTVDWQQIDEIDAGAIVDSDCPLLQIYLRAKIIGQRYLVGGEGEIPFVEAVPTFLLAYPMTLWTARALAAERGETRIEEQDIRDAIRVLDRTLGTVSTAQMPKKVRKACTFLLTETDLVIAARNELLGRTEAATEDF